MESVMFWEGHFHQHGVGINMVSGLTYDGHGLDFNTGNIHDPLHSFSAPSKESLHLAMLALALNGDKKAQIFLFPEYPELAITRGIALLTRKISSYEKFNAMYPGFGGFFPWYTVTDDGMTLLPNWSDAVPSLDNGELIWGLVAVTQVLETQGYDSVLAQRYRAQLDKMAKNAAVMFYDGGGKIRGVSKIFNITAEPTAQNYALQTPCSPPCYLDDPYEGELMAFFLELFADFSTLYNSTQIEKEKESIWIYKRAKLQRAEYVTPTNESITVEKGWWFSAHEKWKYLMMPYLDISINRRIFMNGEKARTWNSAVNQIPGMFASVTDVAQPDNYYPGYISATGVQSIAFEQVLRTDVVTPYSSYPAMLANQTIGLAWYHTMISGPAMQNPFGSTESVNVTGTAISPVVTWDSKITTVTAMCGGVAGINRGFLQRSKFDSRSSAYQRFSDIVEREWGMVFPEGEIHGEDLPFAIPSVDIPHTDQRPDFTECS